MLTVSHPSSPMMAPSPGRSKRDRERPAGSHRSSPLQTFANTNSASQKSSSDDLSSSSTTSSERSAGGGVDDRRRSRRMSVDVSESRTETLPTEDEQMQDRPGSASSTGVPSKPNLQPLKAGKRPEPAQAQDATSGRPTDAGTAKRQRPPDSTDTVLPAQYELCEIKDLVAIISNMLMELIRFNDGIPLQDGQLTRFHSRAPPGISVRDYLQRIATHVTLSPPILLAMVYYIDKLCLLYPAFTISSLTVHRFLIAAATVGAKGLSDSFWTNSTYARVGGVSLKELALLELEFLWRVQWRIVPKPEVLVDYYRSLVARCDGYVLEEVDEEKASKS